MKRATINWLIWPALLFWIIVIYRDMTGLEQRIALLEKEASQTIEIIVERAYDADMGVYDYQLVATGDQLPIKRGRKRLTQQRVGG